MSDHMPSTAQADILTLTAEITASYVGSNAHVQADQIPEIIRSIRKELSSGGEVETTAAAVEPTPKLHASSVKKSITPDGLISFIDNRPYKTLKRHLARHGMTVDDYRTRYGLPKDYPSVAPNYSAARSAMAKKLGLGARGRGAQPAEAAAPAPAATKASGRKAKGA